VLVLGLPILDMLRVMVSRIARGQSPFVADRTHLHHRLLESGLSQYETVSLVYGVQFVLVVLAYLLRYSLDGAILLTYVGICGLVLLGMREAETHAEYLRSRTKRQDVLRRLVARASRTGLFAQVPLKILRVTVPFLLVIGALDASSVGTDIPVLSAVLFGILLVSLLVKSVPFFMIERLSAYATAATVTFLLERSEGLMRECEVCIHLVYAALALVIALWVRVSTSHFKVSSLDVLILLAALVAPSLRGLGLRDIGVVALESIVLFYAIEVILQERERGWDPLRVGVLTTLGILAVRGLIG
jgi:UDP-GlcNAc:undecaprenyl-phosphate GlcNAc-1-phosphate transferase